MSEEIEIIVNTSNNVTTALMHCRKLEKIMLKTQLDDIARQQKKSRLFIERHRAAFLQSFKGRHKDWWKMDTHVRENVRKDLDNLLYKKAFEIKLKELENDMLIDNNEFINENANSIANVKKQTKIPLNNKDAVNLTNGEDTKNEIKFSGNLSTILNHFSFNKKPTVHHVQKQSINQQQLQQPLQQQKLNGQVVQPNPVYFKPNKLKLPDVKPNRVSVSFNYGQKIGGNQLNIPPLMTSYLLKGQQQQQQGKKINDNPTLSEDKENSIDLYRTKSIILNNTNDYNFDTINSDKTQSKLEKQSSVKLPNIKMNKAAKYASNSQSTLSTINLNDSSVASHNMNSSLANVYNREEYINQMKQNGDLSKEEEEFFATLSRFLKRSPFYVEKKESLRSVVQDKSINVKSKNKEKLISQSRDKRFENLVESLVNFQSDNGKVKVSNK